jgi:hypothetical protein
VLSGNAMSNCLDGQSAVRTVYGDCDCDDDDDDDDISGVVQKIHILYGT